MAPITPWNPRRSERGQALVEFALVIPVLFMLLFGLIGYGMMLLRLEVVPLILGFILGPPFEENLRRALLLSRGDFGVFVHRPISAGALAIVAALLAWSLWSYLRGKGGMPAMEELAKDDAKAG